MDKGWCGRFLSEEKRDGGIKDAGRRRITKDLLAVRRVLAYIRSAMGGLERILKGKDTG